MDNQPPQKHKMEDFIIYDADANYYTTLDDVDPETKPAWAAKCSLGEVWVKVFPLKQDIPFERYQQFQAYEPSCVPSLTLQARSPPHHVAQRQRCHRR